MPHGFPPIAVDLDQPQTALARAPRSPTDLPHRATKPKVTNRGLLRAMAEKARTSNRRAGGRAQPGAPRDNANGSGASTVTTERQARFTPKTLAAYFAGLGQAGAQLGQRVGGRLGRLAVVAHPCQECFDLLRADGAQLEIAKRRPSKMRSERRVIGAEGRRLQALRVEMPQKALTCLGDRGGRACWCHSCGDYRPCLALLPAHGAAALFLDPALDVPLSEAPVRTSAVTRRERSDGSPLGSATAPLIAARKSLISRGLIMRLNGVEPSRVFPPTRPSS
jgi:hypothetical protein